jgi:sugar lactone lactonase YvrE
MSGSKLLHVSQRRLLCALLLLAAALSALGQLRAPLARAAGPASSLFVSSYSTNQVLRYDGATGAFVEVFAPGGGLDLPWGITFGPDGNLYVSSYSTNQVLRYNGLTGAFIDAFTSGRQLIAPTGLVFGPDGNLYVTSGGDQVVRFNGATGAYIDVFVSGGGLNGPTGLAFGPDVDLYVGSYNNDQVVHFDGGSGGYVATRPPGNGLAGPDGLAFGPDGNLYVSSFNSNQVLRYNGATGAFVDRFVAAGSGGLKGPAHLVFRSAPQITSQPASQTIARGQSATLSVVAAGVGPLAYQWYRGPSGDPSTPIIGATGSSYTTPALSATSQYWVRVINAEGAVDSATATVITTDAPVITAQPATLAIASGETATLSVSALGEAPLAYQWYQGLSGDTSKPIAGATGSSYTTPALTASANYWVRISNAKGHADSDSALVLVAVANIRLPVVRR